MGYCGKPILLKILVKRLPVGKILNRARRTRFLSLGAGTDQNAHNTNTTKQVFRQNFHGDFDQRLFPGPGAKFRLLLTRIVFDDKFDKLGFAGFLDDDGFTAPIIASVGADTGKNRDDFMLTGY